LTLPVLYAEGENRKMEVKKLTELEEYLKKLKKVAVAYSGGVDSSFLLFVARKCLGGENTLAVTVVSSLTPPWDLEFAKSFTRKIGVELKLIEGEKKISQASFSENSPMRCYYCRQFNYRIIKEHIPEEFTLVSGTNASDEGDFRPGMKAEQELGIKTPLRDLGITKDQIRHISRMLGIPGWDRPSSACLASPIPFGVPINLQELKLVEKAELFFRKMGFDFIRVRIFPYKTAKIEVKIEDLHRIFQEREKILKKLKDLGFKNITVDLEGYVPAGLKFLEVEDGSLHKT